MLEWWFGGGGGRNAVMGKLDGECQFVSVIPENIWRKGSKVAFGLGTRFATLPPKKKSERASDKIIIFKWQPRSRVLKIIGKRSY